ncbi:hypothetical protein SOCEGT47_017880 [Sorangium cellulosum]|uniref:Glycoside hydrolase 123 N-terminal domain-containing protein n=1 Tax=Sorangium cellulosum TaxID=56 RepID=A0A4P2PWY1_SORCE|nr:glycoside hydrolase domain-containing protein [Sorangium cellulosum]AUX21307.1 hypothetical protein SOCEGT47_017880 [Sorangium cellulosum]
MPRSHLLTTAALLSALSSVTLPAPAAAAGERDLGRPQVWGVDDGTRVRREDAGLPLSRGEGNPLFRPGEPIRLGALRAEVVAFQVIVEAGTEPVHGVTVELPGLAPAAGTGAPEKEPGAPAKEPGAPAKEPGAPQHPGHAQGAAAAPAISIARFVEHYVEIKRRSRNERRPAESLGWSPAARPPDDRHLGFLPDALIPVDLAPPWAPYPLEVGARETRAVWIDLHVPEDAAAGVYQGNVLVRSASHGDLAALDLRLEVASATLPYSPVDFIAFYEAGEVAERVGDGPAVEQQLWQLLHEHHVDGFASVRTPAEVERLRAAIDGSLYTKEHRYRGPGAGVPPSAVALGAYGGFGDPREETLPRVEAVADLLPPTVDDVMLYAIDEQCESPRGPGWRRLIRGSRLSSRILVGHSCGEIHPLEQDVDLVLTPANRFDSAWARAAREAGKRLWVYNGALPRTGTFMIDAPLTGLMANGWIAASHEVGRWFLWETAFWHDGNRGGKGPIDPFTVAENFHNQDGDACLGDGMLLYPGTQRGPFASRSIGFPGVLPSMRLKSLRRGIQDAGYIALARAASPGAADAIVKEVIPAALDEALDTAPTAWSSEGAPFFEGRAALRALIPKNASLDAASVRRVLAEAAAARRALVPRAQGAGEGPAWGKPGDLGRWRTTGLLLVGVAALVVAIVLFRWGRSYRKAG